MKEYNKLKLNDLKKIVNDRLTANVQQQVMNDSLCKAFVRTHEDETWKSVVKAIKPDQANDVWERKQNMLYS